MEELALSVVVVAYQQRDALLECLEACARAAARCAGGGELIVVDNGALAPLIRERHPGMLVVEPGFNFGFAGAVGLGVAAARGRWIALVNDDATVESDAFERLLAAGERAPAIGSVAAQIRFSDARDRVNSAGIVVDALGVATERLAGARIGEASEPGEVFGASACCAVYRRSLLAALGGFDERFFAYLEDVDFAWRAQAAGWKCVYEPRAVAHHAGSASAGHGSPRKYYLVGRNRVWLLARNATARQLMRILPALVLYDLAYVVYVAFTDRTLAPLRGRLAGLRSWRRLRRERLGGRTEVPLAPVSWRASLAQHRAYRELAAAG